MAEAPAPQEAPQQDASPQDAPETGQPEFKSEESRQAVLADLAKERAERKKLAKELEQFRTASLSEAEKAVAEAEKRGESKASERYASRLVDESFRAATVGRTLTPDALLAFDRKAFITDDGDVDRDSLVKWVEANAVEAEAPRTPSFDGGSRTTAPAPVGMNGLIRKAVGRA